MGKFLRRLFNLYPNEEKKALLFAALGFFWALGVTSALKFADALFLIHVGAEALPNAYILAASGNIVAALFMLYGYNHISPTRLFLSVISFGIFFYTLAYIFLVFQPHHDSKTLWYALKIFGWVFFTMVTTSFWTFIDQYYHLQDAKRFYSIFSSTIFLGLASTGIIMRLGELEPKNLILFVLFLLGLTFYWIGLISRRIQFVSDDSETDSPVVTQSLRDVLRTVFSSPFAIFLMSICLIVQILIVITEFNYLSDFAKRFDTPMVVEGANEQTNPLILFLGQCLTGVSIFNLIFGLFIYSRLAYRFGISNMIVWSPAVFILLFSGWLTSDTLLFPILGFFVIEGMLYVIDDCNFTLLLNAVPTKIKYKIRITIESFFEPIGMMCSALILSFVKIDSKIIALVLSVIVLVVAFALRSQYLKGIYQNLAENAIHFQRNIGDWWEILSKKGKKGVEYRLLAILKQGDESSQIMACEGLLAFDEEAILYKLLQFADYLTIQGKVHFIELINQSSFYMNTQVLDCFHRWILENPDPALKNAVHFYLAQQGLLHPEKIIADLESDNLTIKGAAILALKKSWAHQPPTTAALNRTLAAQHLHEFLESSKDEEICMGLKIMTIEASAHDVDIMMPFLKHPSLQISRTAAASLAKIIDKQSQRYVHKLLKRLSASSDNEYRLSCLKALGEIVDSSLVKEIIASSVHFRPNERRLTETIIFKMGLRTVPTLLSITKDMTMHDRCRVLAGRILGRLALPQLRANLYDIISIEIERAYFYFYHYHSIPLQYPEHDLKILQDALQTGYHSVMDFIIQLLGIAGSIEDCELLSRSLRSRNLKVKSQVVEAIEKTCDPKIFRLLQPLVADCPLDEKMKAYRKGGRTPLSLTELLDKLDQSSSLADQIMAATLQCRLNLPSWRDSIRQQMPLNDEIFHHFAYELLES